MESRRNCWSILGKFLPYGVLESWDDLNPRLYLAVHIYWLKFFGMWFNKHSLWSPQYWLQMLYGAVVLFLTCILPTFGEVYYLLQHTDDVGDIAEGLYLFLSEIYTFFKISVFWWNKAAILSLLRYLHCPEFHATEPEHWPVLRRRIATARFVMTYYSTMCVGAVSVGIIMPLTENFEILPTNVEYPYIDVYRSPIYWIMYLHHVYYKPAVCIIDGVMDTMLAAFIASAIGQIEILAFNLQNFDMLAERRRRREADAGGAGGAPSDDYYVMAVLKDCIKHHNIIISYVALIERAFSLASVLQLMLSAMVLCLVGVQFLSIENPASHPMQIMWMVIYLSCMLIEVFILCWFGDHLIGKV
ncbi:unnamed protein product [Plutella xylostella]|uniref:Odorant receptor n=1 Tax=Plutella xylostella TaxID=51655 RepID=A0A8S4DI16_PLUXY|nr:unnamed protein product [Plutella xylostella]